MATTHHTEIQTAFTYKVRYGMTYDSEIRWTLSNLLGPKIREKKKNKKDFLILEQN